MTAQETLSLLYLAKSLYPRDKSLDKPRQELVSMAKAWTELLRDIPFEQGKAAVAAHAMSSPYAPAISEIRAYARRLSAPEPLGADEAWALAIRAVRKFGDRPYKYVATGKYPREMAQESLPPEVWRVVDLMGYPSMCRSEHPDTLRARFIETWERQQKRQRERETLLPFLPEKLRGTMLAIEGGEGGAEGADEDRN